MGLIDWSSLIVQAINLAIIIFVLKKFVFVPYLAYIDQEITKRAELEKKTKDASRIANEAESNAKEVIDTAKKEATTIRKEARELAKREASLALSASKDEAAALKNKALGEIEAERQSLEREMKSRILSVAIQLNQKLLGENKKNTELLEQFAKNI